MDRRINVCGPRSPVEIGAGHLGKVSVNSRCISVVKSRYSAVYAALVVAFVWLSLDAIRTNFIVLDEYAHVPAGISYWQVGRFDLYRETPPLVQAVAALPAVLSGTRLDYTAVQPGRSEWRVGLSFLLENAAQLQGLMCRSRYVIMMFGLGCGLLIFWSTRRLYGDGVALTSAALWFLDPSVVAFSSVVTADVGSAALCLLATYCYWLFLQKPSLITTSVAGFALGLAQSSKFTMLALYAAWSIVSVLWLLSNRSERTGTSRAAFSLGVLAIFVVSLLVLNSVYLFTGTFTRLGGFDFRSRAFSGEVTADSGDAPSGNRFRGSILSGLPVPLPRDYVRGLDSQKWDEEQSLTNVQDGRPVRGGRWYSPFKTLFLKLPPGTLILITASMTYLLILARRRLEEWLVWISAMSLLGVLCTQTGLNWPVRYSIPALPLILVGTGAGLSKLSTTGIGKSAIFACLLWNVVELAQVAPHFLSYASPLAGGPLGAQSRLHGSNYDWGQDLLWLRRWHDQHREIRPLVISYFGVQQPHFVGLEEGKLPASFLASEAPQPIEGAQVSRTFYWALSSNFLNGVNGLFQFDNGRVVLGRLRSSLLRPTNAIARAGYSIYVFKIDLAGPKFSDPGLAAQKSLKGCIHEITDELWLDAVP